MDFVNTYMNFKLWLESHTPSILYHHSSPKNSQSILRQGLRKEFDQTSPGSPYGGIFLTNKPDVSSHSDVYEVDVRGLPVEDDWSGQPEDPDEHWYIVWNDIAPNRLKLLPKTSM